MCLEHVKNVLRLELLFDGVILHGPTDVIILESSSPP